MNLVDPQTAAAIRSLGNSQVKVLTGTVTSTPTNAQTTPVRLDNDQAGNGLVEPILIPSICGIIPQGTRVTIFTVPPAGMVIVGIIGAPYNLIALWDYFLAMTQNTSWIVRRFYIASDTWNKPTDPLFLGVVVRVQSGGGGSGGTSACNSQTSTSAGGQGGGYIEAYTRASFLSATAAVTVGAGGTAGAAGSNPGGTGGTSSFVSGATTLSIPGGEGGAGGGSGPGTVGSVGQTTQKGGDTDQISGLVAVNFETLDVQQGDDGGTGWRTRFGDDGLIVPGFGGGSRMGAATGVGTLVTATSGGPAVVDNKQIPPVAGWPFGGGASGRGANDYATAGTIAAAAGAAGGQGCVIVDEIYRT